MSTYTRGTFQHLARAMVLILILVMALLGLGAPTPATAQGPQVIRLGEFQVEWYCNQRGYNVTLINNQTDWACTFAGGGIAFVLNQTHFNQICQATYRNQYAYALRDQNKPTPAYNWSCYVNVGSTGYVPVPNARRLGGFSVDWYCNQRGYGAALANSGADWACTFWGTSQPVFILGQNDFNYICQATYRNSRAYAVRDQNNAVPAYNWSCYVPTSTTVRWPTPIPVQRLVRLGEFQVEWYCNQRGYNVTLVNNQSDWACTYWHSGQTAFVLNQTHFNYICRVTYRNSKAFAVRDQMKPTPAYNWSCYIYR